MSFDVESKPITASGLKSPLDASLSIEVLNTDLSVSQNDIDAAVTLRTPLATRTPLARPPSMSPMALNGLPTQGQRGAKKRTVSSDVAMRISLRNRVSALCNHEAPALPSVGGTFACGGPSSPKAMSAVPDVAPWWHSVDAHLERLPAEELLAVARALILDVVHESDRDRIHAITQQHQVHHSLSGFSAHVAGDDDGGGDDGTDNDSLHKSPAGSSIIASPHYSHTPSGSSLSGSPNTKRTRVTFADSILSECSLGMIPIMGSVTPPAALELPPPHELSPPPEELAPSEPMDVATAGSPNNGRCSPPQSVATPPPHASPLPRFVLGGVVRRVSPPGALSPLAPIAAPLSSASVFDSGVLGSGSLANHVNNLSFSGLRSAAATPTTAFGHAASGPFGVHAATAHTPLARPQLAPLHSSVAPAASPLRRKFASDPAAQQVAPQCDNGMSVEPVSDADDDHLVNRPMRMLALATETDIPPKLFSPKTPSTSGFSTSSASGPGNGWSHTLRGVEAPEDVQGLTAGGRARLARVPSPGWSDKEGDAEADVGGDSARAAVFPDTGNRILALTPQHGGSAEQYPLQPASPETGPAKAHRRVRRYSEPLETPSERTPSPNLDEARSKKRRVRLAASTEQAPLKIQEANIHQQSRHDIFGVGPEDMIVSAAASEPPAFAWGAAAPTPAPAFAWGGSAPAAAAAFEAPAITAFEPARGESDSLTHKVPAGKVDTETNNPHDMEPSTRAGSLWDTRAHADAAPRRGTAAFAVDPSTPGAHASSASESPPSPGGDKVPPAGLSLFVRALHTQTEWHHLQPLFEEFDRGVEVRVLYNRVGTQSRGNGFINFKTVEAATAALAALNGVAGPYGVPLQLAFAWPDERYVHEATAKLFVRHVSPTATVASLTAIFAAHGAVAKCDIQADTSSAGARERTGDLMAYVTFTDAAGAASARKKIHRSIAMAGASEPLDVRCAEPLAARDRLLSPLSFAESAVVLANFEVAPLGGGDSDGSDAASEQDPLTMSRSAVTAYDEDGNETINNYTLWNQIGKGAAGEVFLAIDENTSSMRAVKVIPRSNAPVDDIEDMMKEVAIMKKIRHKHIVALYECIDDPESDTVYLVMQYIPDGPIAVLSEDGTCPPVALDDIAHYAKQLASALEFIHKKGILHGDIKPDNILVDTSSRDVKSRSGRKAFFADFGVSRAFVLDGGKGAAAAAASCSDQTDSISLSRTGDDDDDTPSPPRVFGQDHSLHGRQSEPLLGVDDGLPPVPLSLARKRKQKGPILGMGTPAFMSPELYDGARPDSPADMWAFGVTLYVMMYGKLPFGGTSYFAMKDDVLHATLVLPAAASEDVAAWRGVVGQLLERDPLKRITADDLVRHALFQ
jgi:serine/threonine protein kinase